MQAPPEGTVPRERITLNAALTTGREADGPIQTNGEPLPRYAKTIPIPVTRKLLDLGRKRYDITCGTCHGPLGDGDSIVARQMALRPPPSLHRYVDKPAGYIYEVATKGFGMMASYAGELTVEERWAVVAYIRALQLSQSTPAAELPPDVRQQLEALPASGAAPAARPRPTARGEAVSSPDRQRRPSRAQGRAVPRRQPLADVGGGVGVLLVPDHGGRRRGRPARRRPSTPTWSPSPTGAGSRSRRSSC